MTDLFDFSNRESVWDTPGLFADFKALQEAGHSHPEVARRLNAKYPGVNLTKNACVGKLNRSGIVRPSARAHHVDWDIPGLVDELKTLHAQSIVFPKIAKMMTEKFAHLGVKVTAKAVRAKSDRLGLPKRPKNTEGVKRRRAKERGKGWKFPMFSQRLSPQDEAGRLEYKRMLNAGEIKGRGALAVASTEDDFTPAEMRKTLLDLEKGECKWPYGDGPFTFCGRKASDTYPSYCVHHAMVHFLGTKQTDRMYCEAAE